MYKQVANIEVPIGVLFRALFYTYVYPKNGFYKKLRDRFGYRAKVVLNSELAIQLVLTNLENNYPGMKIGIDSRLYKRFRKLVASKGYQPETLQNHKDLLTISEDPRCLAVVLTDGYASMSSRQKNRLYRSNATTIIVQRRMQPKSVDLDMDVYIWEPKQMPKSISCSVVVVGEAFDSIRQRITEFNSMHQSPTTREVIKELYYASKGRINTYRRLDQKPSALMVRLVYDFYKGQLH